MNTEGHGPREGAAKSGLKESGDPSTMQGPGQPHPRAGHSISTQAAHPKFTQAVPEGPQTSDTNQFHHLRGSEIPTRGQTGSP